MIPLIGIPAFIIVSYITSCYSESIHNEQNISEITEESRQSDEKKLYIPSAGWIGKTLRVKFSARAPRVLRGKIFTVKIDSIKTDLDGFKYFITENVFTEKGHRELYFQWFGNMITECIEL